MVHQRSIPLQLALRYDMACIVSSQHVFAFESPCVSLSSMRSPSRMGFISMLSFHSSTTVVASFDPAQDDELLALNDLHAHIADHLLRLPAPLPPLPLQAPQHTSSDATFHDVLALSPIATMLTRPSRLPHPSC